ncbi:MAG: MATE family efflux transporter [Oscillospiraceae bacterium]|nr:MATE family efflux transporter [Oscillospiraceae bacterium]
MTNTKKPAGDLGTAPVGKLLVRMAIPCITAQLINALYNIVDRIYIGRLPDGGTAALAGLGVSFPIIMIISAFAALVGMGGAPLCSIRMGEKKQQEAEAILASCFSALLILSVTLTAIFFLTKAPLLRMFGASEAIFPYANDYLTIYLCGTVFVQISLGMNAFITSQGFASVSMKTVLIGAILNIILDPVFIFALGMGVRGAALATVISQGVSAVWVLCFLFGKKTKLHIRRDNIIPRMKHLLPALALGVSPFIMQTTESLIQIAFTSGMQKYGDDAYVSAVSVMISCMSVLLMPLMGLAQGAQPIISYNYGAKNFDRVRRCNKLMTWMMGIYCIAVWAFVEIWPTALMRVFSSDVTLLEIGAHGIRIFMFGVSIIFLQVSCQHTFLALGQAKVSMLLALLRKVFLLIPLALLLPWLAVEVGVLPLSGTDALYLAEPIADICAALVTFTVYRARTKKLLAE